MVSATAFRRAEYEASKSSGAWCCAVVNLQDVMSVLARTNSKPTVSAFFIDRIQYEKKAKVTIADVSGVRKDPLGRRKSVLLRCELFAIVRRCASALTLERVIECCL